MMPSYETLDAVADAYIPALLIIALGAALWPVRRRRWRDVSRRCGHLLSLLAIAYGLMALDSQLQIWPALQLDYSTHTAVALVLCVFLHAYVLRLRLAWWLSLFCYALLMWYQRYHGVADIVTTATVVGALAFIGRTTLRACSSRPLSQLHAASFTEDHRS